MQKISTVLFVVLLFSTANVYSQLAESSWGFGFGFSYPRFGSVDVGPKDGNHGGYLSIQRNFSENVGLRITGFYREMKGAIPSVLFKEAPGGGPSTVKANWNVDEMKTRTMGGMIDVMYYFVPCDPISPFLHFGGGMINYEPNYVYAGVYNPEAIKQTTGVFDFGLGSEFRIGNSWKINVDFSWNVTASGLDGINRRPDGYNFRSGIFGSSGDSYISLDLGLLYYFSKGSLSDKCLPVGIAEVPELDYEKIENIVKKYIPREVIKEVVVEKHVKAKNSWVLVGVNFDFNSAVLKSEAYPILFHAVKVLQSNSLMKVEIIGHSDNLGPEDFNLKMSKDRAETVKDYLLSKGVSANRLTITGKGETLPIADNKTAKGRAMNRRIEFKVLN